MGAESSLAVLQAPAIGSYHDQYESSPHPQQFISLKSTLMLSSNLLLGLASGGFSKGFRTRIRAQIMSLPIMFPLLSNMFSYT
jgi:hypothetical protein